MFSHFQLFIQFLKACPILSHLYIYFSTYRKLFQHFLTYLVTKSFSNIVTYLVIYLVTKCVSNIVSIIQLIIYLIEASSIFSNYIIVYLCTKSVSNIFPLNQLLKSSPIFSQLSINLCSYVHYFPKYLAIHRVNKSGSNFF